MEAERNFIVGFTGVLAGRRFTGAMYDAIPVRASTGGRGWTILVVPVPARN